MEMPSPSSEIKAYLKHVVGTSPGHVYPIYKSKITIGRNTKADIFIDNANVSRNHLSISEVCDEWFAVDLGGVNGTYVNNKKLVPRKMVPLEYGSIIFLGPPADAPIAFTFLRKTDVLASSYTSRLAMLTEQNTSTKEKDMLSKEKDSKLVKGKRTTSAVSSKQKSKKENLISSKLKPPNDDISGCESDSSISSLDSLKTRMRKYSAGKKRKRRVLSSDDEVKPSCSTKGREKPKFNVNIVSDESSSSGASSFVKAPETNESQSLLEDSITLINNDYKFPPQHETFYYDSDGINDTLYGNAKKLKSNAQLKTKDSNLEEIQQENDRLTNLAGELSLKVCDLENKNKSLSNILEDDLLCNICTEVLIMPITLGCSHTFCEFCINEWKRKKNQCPICRERIQTQNKVLVLNSVINKLVGFMDCEFQQKREDVIKSRTEFKRTVPKKKGKKNRRRGNFPAPGRLHIGISADVLHFGHPFY